MALFDDLVIREDETEVSPDPVSDVQESPEAWDTGNVWSTGQPSTAPGNVWDSSPDPIAPDKGKAPKVGPMSINEGVEEDDTETDPLDDFIDGGSGIFDDLF